MHYSILFMLLVIGTSCGMRTRNSEAANASTTIQQEAYEMKFNKLVWSDEFDGNALNNSKWTPIEGDGCPELCGFGNNELQYYTDSRENIWVHDGLLVINAKKDPNYKGGYTSGKLVTRNKAHWKYGRVEVRAKLPVGRGTWSAIWMLPTMEEKMNWPLDGEIDIMEHVGYQEGMIYGTIHTKAYNHLDGTQKSDSILIEDVGEAFHDYALEWDEEEMSWYVDGKKYFSIQKGNDSYEGWPFDKPFHLILNLAVGGNWGGKKGVADDIWPEKMIVDYVRVYQ